MQIGYYTGQPNGNDATAMANWKSRQSSATALMGAPPSVIGVSEQGLNSNPGTLFYSVQQSGFTGLVVDEVPLGASVAENQAIAAGTYTGYFQNIVKAAKTYEFTLLDVRIAPEMNNAGGKPWAISSASQAAAYISAWQKVATDMRAQAIASGITLRTVWNPLCISYNAVSPKSLYPGDAYVDIISADLYSPIPNPGQFDNYAASETVDPSWASVTQAQWLANVNNLHHAWDYQSGNYWNPTGEGTPADYTQPSQGWGFVEHIKFAQAHNKPITLSECGCGLKPSQYGTIGNANEANYYPWLKNALNGVNCLYAIFWITDQSDGAWGLLNGQQPATAASLASAFGVKNNVQPNVVTRGLLILSLSEDAASDGKVTNAQAIVTVDGVAQPAVSITASHTAGATQSISLSLSPGSHTISVAFTNDFCRWVNGGYSTASGDDRNLYLIGATLDGGAVPNSAHTFLGNGSFSLTVTV